MPDVVVYDRYTDGHRRDYFRVLERTLGARVVAGSGFRLWLELVRCRHLVCSTCDDYLGLFTGLSLARIVMGRTTVGLSIRAETAANRRDRTGALKRLALRVLRWLPGPRLITLMPYWAEPKLQRYAVDWMYDLQLWDLPWLDGPRAGASPSRLDDARRLAGDRPLVVAIGHQRQVKGGHFFLELFSDPEIRARFLFVTIGPNWDLDPDRVRRFEDHGGVFMDTELDDDEILGLYGSDTIIWACYRPDYNQSSGIFGRALQLGRPTIVRTGSYLATLQRQLGAPGWAIDYDDVEGARRELNQVSTKIIASRALDEPRCEGFLPSLLGIPLRRGARHEAAGLDSSTPGSRDKSARKVAP